MRCVFALFFLLVIVDVTAAPPSTPSLPLRDGLVIGATGRAGRAAFHTDAMEAEIVAGTWTAPAVNDSMLLPDGKSLTWERAAADKDGWFTNRALTGGYVYIPVTATTNGVLILHASGHNMVYVNGEPRGGDPYQYGYVHLPVQLHAGTNHFLFQVGRGRLRAALIPPSPAPAFNLQDPTLPDILAGKSDEIWAAVIVINPTTNTWKNGSLRATAPGGDQFAMTPLPMLLPLSTRKVGFRIPPVSTTQTNKIAISLQLRSSEKGELLDSGELTLSVRRPDETRKETFRSDIDGSIQYFAVVPPALPKLNAPPRALFLTVHGASVEALGQAEAYAAKSWGYIVAATNRRPYGFDWEDWGRRDALEVLELALAKFQTDPHQTYLTGHSMGGHGTWHLGVTYPDRFAAIGPSAGWISFWSYADARREKNPNDVQALLQRATHSGDTLLLSSNYLHHGIYILHGDADDNVPVEQARTMRAHLAPFHRDFLYHEQPGAGHWWGSPCVDWPPMFDFFARHKIPADDSIREINFSTANPGVSSKSHWISIEAQEHPLNKSTVVIRYDTGARRFSGTTENVARMALATGHVAAGDTVAVELDGQKMENLRLTQPGEKLWLRREKDRWEQSSAFSSTLKGPHRNGPFKEAFYHRMIFVYGSHGSAEENHWAFAKARYDAEQFWYRGNGSVEVVADSEFDPATDPDRSVILYGHADSNKAWNALLANSPVQLRRGLLRVGEREERGDALSCLFIRPRPGSDVALVAVIGGTGMPGMRLTDRVPYFTAGVAYPDCTVFGPETLREGSAAVLGAGFFGNDWSVGQGEFAWLR